MELRSQIVLPRLRLMLFFRFISADFCSNRLPASGRRWRRISVASALILFVASFAAAQDGSSVSGPNDNQKCSVSGTVVNEGTGEAIPRVMVTLMSSPTRYAFTDSNGSFTIE